MADTGEADASAAAAQESKRGGGGGQRSSSQMTQQYFKTRMCPWLAKGNCKKGKQCTYAHSQTEIRIPPNLYKTKLCVEWQKRRCTAGAECHYAHGRQELRHTHNLYKTVYCHFWLTSGVCNKGALCRHAHGREDMRFLNEQEIGEHLQQVALDASAVRAASPVKATSSSSPSDPNGISKSSLSPISYPTTNNPEIFSSADLSQPQQPHRDQQPLSPSLSQAPLLTASDGSPTGPNSRGPCWVYPPSAGQLPSGPPSQLFLASSEAGASPHGFLPPPTSKPTIDPTVLWPSHPDAPPLHVPSSGAPSGNSNHVPNFQSPKGTHGLPPSPFEVWMDGQLKRQQQSPINGAADFPLSDSPQHTLFEEVFVSRKAVTGRDAIGHRHSLSAASAFPAAPRRGPSSAQPQHLRQSPDDDLTLRSLLPRPLQQIRSAESRTSGLHSVMSFPEMSSFMADPLIGEVGNGTSHSHFNSNGHEGVSHNLLSPFATAAMRTIHSVPCMATHELLSAAGSNTPLDSPPPPSAGPFGEGGPHPRSSRSQQAPSVQPSVALIANLLRILGDPKAEQPSEHAGTPHAGTPHAGTPPQSAAQRHQQLSGGSDSAAATSDSSELAMQLLSSLDESQLRTLMSLYSLFKSSDLNASPPSTRKHQSNENSHQEQVKRCAYSVPNNLRSLPEIAASQSLLENLANAMRDDKATQLLVSCLSGHRIQQEQQSSPKAAGLPSGSTTTPITPVNFPKDMRAQSTSPPRHPQYATPMAMPHLSQIPHLVTPTHNTQQTQQPHTSRPRGSSSVGLGAPHLTPTTPGKSRRTALPPDGDDNTAKTTADTAAHLQWLQGLLQNTSTDVPAFNRPSAQSPENFNQKPNMTPSKAEVQFLLMKLLANNKLNALSQLLPPGGALEAERTTAGSAAALRRATHGALQTAGGFSPPATTHRTSNPFYAPLPEVELSGKGIRGSPWMPSYPMSNMSVAGGTGGFLDSKTTDRLTTTAEVPPTETSTVGVGDFRREEQNAIGQRGPSLLQQQMPWAGAIHDPRETDEGAHSHLLPEPYGTINSHVNAMTASHEAIAVHLASNSEEDTAHTPFSISSTPAVHSQFLDLLPLGHLGHAHNGVSMPSMPRLRLGTDSTWLSPDYASPSTLSPSASCVTMDAHMMSSHAPLGIGEYPLKVASETDGYDRDGENVFPSPTGGRNSHASGSLSSLSTLASPVKRGASDFPSHRPAVHVKQSIALQGLASNQLHPLFPSTGSVSPAWPDANSAATSIPPSISDLLSQFDTPNSPSADESNSLASPEGYSTNDYFAQHLTSSGGTESPLRRNCISLPHFTDVPYGVVAAFLAVAAGTEIPRSTSGNSLQTSPRSPAQSVDGDPRLEDRTIAEEASLCTDTTPSFAGGFEAKGETSSLNPRQSIA